MPLIPKINPPNNETSAIKDLKPNKNKISGVQQAITNACQCLILKSYTKDSFKIIPCIIKPVKVANAPANKEIAINPLPKNGHSPVKAVSVVFAPVIPKIKSVNNK